MYFAISKDMDDSPIAKLNENLKKMKEPGLDEKSRYGMIVANYLPCGVVE